jgi:hypothetical protein
MKIELERLLQTESQGVPAQTKSENIDDAKPPSNGNTASEPTD